MKISKALLIGSLLIIAQSAFATKPLERQRLEKLRPQGSAAKRPAGRVTSTTAVQGGLPRVNLEKVSELQVNDMPMTSDGERMVAQVNGEPITVKEFERAFRNLAALENVRDAQQLKALRSGMVQHIIDLEIGRTLIAEHARRLKVDVNDLEVNRAIAAENEKLPAGRKLQDAYISRGQPVEDLRWKYRDDILRDKVRGFVTDKVTTPSAEELETFRKANAWRIQHTTTTRAAHIVFRAVATDTSTSIEQARRNAENVLLEIRAGLDFSEAAQKYSQDRTTYAKGGDLGYFSAGKMYAEFEAAIAGLNPGQVSEVIRTPVGFHLVKVLEKQPDNAVEVYMSDARRKAFGEWQDEQLKLAVIDRFIK